jgi:hypothetical protein
MSGFYLMHRGWQDNPLFGNEAFSKRDAFVWLIEQACFTDQRIYIAGESVVLKRGQLSSSLRFMARAWGWEETKVRRFLTRAQNEKIIAASTAAGQTVVTICNYETYQTLDKSGAAPTAAATPQQRRSAAAKYNELNEGNEKKVDAKASSADEPVSEAFDLFNEFAGQAGWPLVQKRTGHRQASMRARLRDDGIEGWRDALFRARSSPFLGSDPPPSFMSFDWITKPANFAKLVEGNYDHARQPVVRQINPNSTLAAILRSEAEAERESGVHYPEDRLAIPTKFLGRA